MSRLTEEEINVTLDTIVEAEKIKEEHEELSSSIPEAKDFKKEYSNHLETKLKDFLEEHNVIQNLKNSIVSEDYWFSVEVYTKYNKSFFNSSHKQFVKSDDTSNLYSLHSLFLLKGYSAHIGRDYDNDKLILHVRLIDN
jgi:hypothetical protein